MKSISSIKTSTFMLKYLFKIKGGKTYFGIKLLVTIFSSLASLIPVIIPGLIINELLNYQFSKTLVFYIAVLIGLPLIINVSIAIINAPLFRLYKRIDQKLTLLFYRITLELKYEQLENPDIQDLKNRAGDAMHNNIVIVDQICSIIGAIVGLVASASIILLLNPLIILLQVGAVLFNSFITKRYDKKNFLITVEVQKLMRRQFGFTQMVDSVEYAKDIRLFNAEDMLLNKIDSYQNDIDDEVHKSTKLGRNSSIIGTVSAAILQLLIYCIIVYYVINSQMQIGYVSIFLSATSTLGSYLTTIMRFSVSMNNNALKIKDYVDFMKLKKDEIVGHEPFEIPSNFVIEFDHVSFTYPGAETEALKDCSLTIKSNERICIVGENGAGKSTFIKLLVGLYQPTKGEIRINGINIQKLELKDYQKLFSCVFQDYTHFYITLEENILMGSQKDPEKLNSVTEEAGLTHMVEKLPKKYNTQIGKWIDPEGIEPSGGEGQKIAIARALYRGGEIYILDEPTAALDPNAEYQLYSQFDEMTDGKCSIFISHRLSAVKLADRVAVFDNGKIIEVGTHSELMMQNGKYREMYEKQSEFYIQ